MRKFITMLGLMVLVGAAAAHADTIILKNGSVIKGRVTGYADDQFVVMLNTGADRQSRAQIYSGDVARIEFDASAGMNTGAGPIDNGPSVTGTGVKNVVVDRSESGGPVPPTQTPTGGSPRDDPSAVTPDAQPPGSDKDRTQPSAADPDPPVLPKRKGQARSAAVDVIAKRDWTSSGLIVRRGDTIRISASGTVTLDPNTGQTSGPEGINQPDPKKLMGDKPTGSLIAVIGADNDDFIFIGRQAEFTAARDGLLFLSVNEGTLSDNSGSFKAVIEVESNRK
jgi:hypothetical protein